MLKGLATSKWATLRSWTPACAAILNGPHQARQDKLYTKLDDRTLLVTHHCGWAGAKIFRALFFEPGVLGVLGVLGGGYRISLRKAGRHGPSTATGPGPSSSSAEPGPHHSESRPSDLDGSPARSHGQAGGVRSAPRASSCTKAHGRDGHERGVITSSAFNALHLSRSTPNPQPPVLTRRKPTYAHTRLSPPP